MPDEPVAGTAAPPPGAASEAAPRAPAGAVPEAAPSTAPSDAQTRVAELEALVQKYERDIRALKSSSDRRLYEQQQEHQSALSALQAKLEQFATLNMDDDERREYEAEKLRLEREEYRQQAERLQRQIENERATMAYLSWLASLGITPDRLDMTSQEALGQSAAEAIANRIRELEAAAKQQPGPTAQPAQGPRVLAGAQGSTPSSKPTFEDIRKAVSEKLGRPVRDDELFELHRRGEVDLNQIL